MSFRREVLRFQQEQIEINAARQEFGAMLLDHNKSQREIDAATQRQLDATQRQLDALAETNRQLLEANRLLTERMNLLVARTNMTHVVNNVAAPRMGEPTAP